MISKKHQTRGKRKKSLEKALDEAWRRLVYMRANNQCQYCGSSKSLNAHHIYSRSNFSVRWDVDNGVCVCVAHHVFSTQSFHKSPMEMIEWIRRARGEAWYDSLMARACAVMPKKEAVEKFAKMLLKYE